MDNANRKPVWLFDQDGWTICSLENGQKVSIERRRTVAQNVKPDARVNATSTAKFLSDATAVTLTWVLYLEDISSEKRVVLGRYTSESDALNALGSVASCLIAAGNYVFRLTDNTEGE